MRKILEDKKTKGMVKGQENIRKDLSFEFYRAGQWNKKRPACPLASNL